ncbi:sugar phosphate isomerase/epimerase and 4-hydroxyphenylpyruvate domain-containing protein [Rothia sp. AR01]|uniref:3-dehydroshikimate dehydratase n=1 Tax=Rothia santali TaxID=2949643 RepID=A0A9X2HB87_9MICC|nr:sugar phosphate isomerase/epimerase and 4-hydroxyphenylpyruvate domain-containing protein [Rothia santali]MCP3426449.1 sugar phosphate isomerase/epimerase and 4-hydroxyphenylpyruvate domain-containing protein [Rothia santali]
MRTSIATVCLSGTLRQKLRAAAAAGFDGVEIFEQDLVVAPESPEQIRDYAAELGLSLDLYQPFRDVEGTTEEEFRAALRRAEAKFALMNRLGMDLMLVCSNAGTATVGDDAVMTDQLGRLADLAAGYGIRLAYEALAWGRFVDDFEHSWRLVEATDRPNLGVCLDTFHILSRGWPVDAVARIPGEKVFFVQLADAPLMSLDVLSWSRHFRVFPGEGGFDLEGFMVRLLAGGYAGPLSLEIFNDSFRQTSVFRTAVDALRSLRWLQDRTAREIEAAGGSGGADEAAGGTTGTSKAPGGATGASEAATPGERDDVVSRAAARLGELTRLPEADEPSSITWAEVRGQRTEQVEALLGHLGFVCRGRHASKPVQLWEQGGARVVVNEEPRAEDTPSVASLGFEIPDAAAAAARADTLRVPAVPRLTGRGEQEFAAYLAPDGTEVFFCPPASDGGTRWVEEFSTPGALGTPVADEAPGTARDGLAAGHSPTAPPRGSAAGRPSAPEALITGVDHVNLAQPRHHYPESVLFFRAALGLRVQPSQDVPGPTGLVSSQVVHNRERTVRLPLNVSPDLRTEPEVEHVAFACDDVVRLAERARASGLRLLSVPGNYYDDLRARFDLEEGFVTRLAELDLLYDREDGGEFLHFYTQTVGSVFFEVVQRIGDYSGYGAPNAPVRMASQYTRRAELG